MIAENKEIEKPQLTYRDLLKCFYMLLKCCGGKMTITKNVLDNNIPDDVLSKIGVDYIPEMKSYRLYIRQPKKRGIISLQNSLIVPN